MKRLQDIESVQMLTRLPLSMRPIVQNAVRSASNESKREYTKYQMIYSAIMGGLTVASLADLFTSHRMSTCPPATR